LGESHRPALPLRPADAAGVEDLPAHLADLGVPRVWLPDAEDAGDAAMVILAASMLMAQGYDPARAVRAPVEVRCDVVGYDRERSTFEIHFPSAPIDAAAPTQIV